MAAADAPVIDTLRYADNLKQAGVEPSRADGMARALNIELSERVLTKTDLREALGVVDQRVGAVDQRVGSLEQRLGAVEQRLDTVEQRLDTVEQRLDTVDQRVRSVDERLGAVEQRLGAVEQHLGAVENMMNFRFKVMTGTQVFGFTLLMALGLFNVAPKQAAGASPAPAPQPAAVEQPAEP